MAVSSEYACAPVCLPETSWKILLFSSLFIEMFDNYF